MLQNLWKQDKRQNDQLFSGAESIVVLNGKSESETNFQKNNALHVRGHEILTAHTPKADTVSIVLAARLRVSCDLDGFHDSNAVHSNDREERYAALLPSILPS